MPPPSIGSATPVMNEALSESRNATAAPTSSGSPGRLIACGAMSASTKSGGEMSMSGVRMAFGQTQFTLTPCSPYSIAVFFVSPTMPCLLAV